MKKQKNVKNAKTSDKGLTIECQRDETEEHAIARTLLNPALQSAWTLKEYINSPVDLELQALIDCLEQQVDMVKDVNLTGIEQILLVQAYTLDAIANSLFRRSKNQEYLKQLEAYLKLGLRAQSQSRANLEALTNMKNPKTQLNQTNIAHNQQVNNGMEKRNPPNELLEKTDGQQLELGTQETAGDADSAVEAVAEVNRTENA